ncbi:MAG: CBS domain-containing protein [Chloroflexi bacterium]|nr:CBS domain-containing protein [Chloroflexota bacterium]
MRAKTVGEIVKGHPVYIVQENDTVLDAARYMTEYQIGAVPVLKEGELVGIISERDLMTRVVARELNPALTHVGEVMTRKMITLEHTTTCQDALTKMEQIHIRHMPVMAGKRIIGCVSLRELQVRAREGQVETRE